MKKILLGSFLLFSTLTLSTLPAAAQTTQQNTSKASISFADQVHDFGQIVQGTPVTYVFSFKNTGKDPLVLTSVAPSCGCTTPEWPHEPVKPGASATIKATYNAANMGTFTKTITVMSNAKEGNVILTIKGEVKPKS
jgi:hypothetical protein